MKILTVGDVVGEAGIAYLERNLRTFASREKAGLVAVNGENATSIHGLAKNDAERILDAGADIITLGNHSFSYRDLYSMLDDGNSIIRPANYPPQSPGSGYAILNTDGMRILCMNVSGTVFMDQLDSPFEAVEKILRRESGNYDLSLLDVHAEATSEKYAIARVFDGQIDIIYGTHTHVRTDDGQKLPKGTLYISDIGMTGPTDGILGTEAGAVITKLRYHMPAKFIPATGNVSASGALFDTEAGTVKPVSF